MTNRFYQRLASAASHACGLMLVLSAIASSASAFDGVTSAPEIDPGALSSALALLIGGTMIVRDRFRRK